MGGPGEIGSASPVRATLETKRILLEPVAPEHAEGIFQATIDSRPELLPWMPWARDPSLQGAQAAAADSQRAWLDDREFHFAVVERESAKVLGVVGLNREAGDTAELHYWIRSDRAGRGLTTEACQALIKWAWKTLRLRRLTLWAGRDNHASRRVASKLGFMYLGPLDWRPEGGLGDFPAERYDLREDDTSRYLGDR